MQLTFVWVLIRNTKGISASIGDIKLAELPDYIVTDIDRMMDGAYGTMYTKTMERS